MQYNLLPKAVSKIKGTAGRANIFCKTVAIDNVQSEINRQTDYTRAGTWMRVLTSN